MYIGKIYLQCWIAQSVRLSQDMLHTCATLSVDTSISTDKYRWIPLLPIQATFPAPLLRNAWHASITEKSFKAVIKSLVNRRKYNVYMSPKGKKVQGRDLFQKMVGCFTLNKIAGNLTVLMPTKTKKEYTQLGHTYCYPLATRKVNSLSRCDQLRISK